MSIEKWQCGYAHSLGALERSHGEAWGTHGYVDQHLPTVFFGIYGLNDFHRMWRHKGRKAILWAGSDIQHFIKGYFLDDSGDIRVEPEALAQYINKYCESYVENGVEHEALMVLGIESKIVPSFMGDVNDYYMTSVRMDKPQVYASVSGDNFAMYGWELIEIIADKCNVDFHLYGNNAPWVSKHPNVFVHGRVPKEQMNEEIKVMHAGLRTLEFDGFSEVLAKSVLWGQYPISRIGYPHIDSYRSTEELISLLNSLKDKTEPNRTAREYYLANLNKYPWNEKN